MLKRILTTIKYDIKFQWRHGFYFVYSFFCIFYIAVLRFLPAEWKSKAAVFILFSDTCTLGFFFIGGIVLLERNENILEGLFVTPLRLREYLIARVISLTFLTTIMAALIIFVGYGIPEHPVHLTVGVILSSAMFTLAGLAIAAKAKSVNNYFFLAIIYTPLSILPFLEFLGIIPMRIFYFIPTEGSIILFQAGFEHTPLPLLIYGYIFLAVGIIPIFILAERWFNKYVILKIGD